MPATITESLGTNARDFSTMIAGEAALPADITSTDEIRILECFDDSTFTDNDFMFSGTVTDATRYIQLWAAVGERHTGTRATGVQLEPAAGQTMAAIRLQDDFIRVFYIEIDCQNHGNGASASGIQTDSVGSGATHYIGNCLIYDNNGGGNNNRGVDFNDNEVTAFVFGNVCINIDVAGYAFRRSVQITAYNNVAYKCALNSQQGFLHATTVNAPLLINNISLESGGNDFDTTGFSASSSHNTSSDGTAGQIGTHAIVDALDTTEFVNTGAGTEDVHLKSVDSLSANSGVTVASLGITPDILTDAEGNARGFGGVWDRGAFESSFLAKQINDKKESFVKDSFKKRSFRGGSFR